ncbi:MAG: cold shock and DUF1294 domain-containing protein [Devosiaceae bacterium]|nr:cold shock and DUF1294 domain-containing protein [Devosiaceae bacterium]
MSRTQAQLVDWNDQRGFGFARLPGGADRVFVHVKSFNPHMPRPKAGDQLELEIVAGRDGRPAAASVDILGQKTGKNPSLSLHLATAAILLILLQIGLMIGVVPMWLASFYVSMGALALIAYSWDKKAAQIGAWRISEARLHLIDFSGGIIGGLLAQHMYRHKMNKPAFQKTTVAIIIVHAILLGLLGSGLIVLPMG